MLNFIMIRIAIPIFQSRVSPVFDTCTQIMLVDFDKDIEIERKEVYLDELSISERVALLQKLHVITVIRSGISDLLHNMLKNAKITLIDGVAGEVDQVVSAFMSNRLDEPRFHMPGYRAK